MTITESVLIFATLAAPVLAVQAQKWIERIRERRAAQRRIFYALMATRATRVAPDHVQALNMIDLEFSGSGWRGQTAAEKEVVNRWHIYADHLNEQINDTNEAQMTAWSVKGYDLFTDLLDALARALGYKFDKVQLRRGIYYPRAHDEAERGKAMLEAAVYNALTGRAELAMKITEFPPSFEPPAEAPKGSSRTNSRRANA